MKIINKFSGTSKVPTTTDIDVGEITINTADSNIHIRKNDDDIVEIYKGMKIYDVADEAARDQLVIDGAIYAHQMCRYPMGADIILDLWTGSEWTLVEKSLIPPKTFEMRITSPTQPGFSNVINGSVTVTDNTNGTWQVTSDDEIQGMRFDTNKSSITEVDIIRSIHFTTGRLFMSGLTSLVKLDFTNFDTSNITNFQAMFSIMSSLTVMPNLNSLNTSNGVIMASILDAWESMATPFDLSSWDTSSATDMNSIFNKCESIVISPNLSNWDTSSVTNTGTMFARCTLLDYVDIRDFDTSNTTIMGGMFRDNSNLRCITNLDTITAAPTEYVGTNNLFYNSNSIVSPDAAAQTLIVDGADWVNPNPCPIP